MNRTLKTSLVLIHGGLITAMLMVISAGILVNHEATSQTGNATSAANQTSQSLGNLTKADFLNAQTSLANARDGIFDGDNLTSFRSLNAADNSLYTVATEVGPEVGDLLQQQIAPARENINNAQEAIVNGDLARALQDVNSASTVIAKITIPLPSGETEEE
jgi:hypothetical protein